VILTWLRRMMLGGPAEEGSFWDANAAGEDIRMVDSPWTRLRIARQKPDTPDVVFYAIGFEEDRAVDRADRAGPRRRASELLVFCNHVTIIPGHQGDSHSPDLRRTSASARRPPGRTVTACRPYDFIAREHGKPVVLRGVRAAGTCSRRSYMIMKQLAEGRSRGGEPVLRVGALDGNRSRCGCSRRLRARHVLEWSGLRSI